MWFRPEYYKEGTSGISGSKPSSQTNSDGYSNSLVESTETEAELERKKDSEVEPVVDELEVDETEVDEPEVELEADPPNIDEPNPAHSMLTKSQRVQIQLG